MIMKKTKLGPGFTLVESLIVVALIGNLVALLFLHIKITPFRKWRVTR